MEAAQRLGRGKTVCTERLDCWDFDGKGWGLELPCMGMFDERPGQDLRLADYFDNRCGSQAA